MKTNSPIDDQENFADLLEQSFTDMKPLKPGELVEAEIVSISGDTIFLQLSGKSEGLLDKAELTDKEGNVTVQEGETIKAYFLYAKNGEMQFTTKISGDKAAKALLESAYKSGIPVEGTVQKEIKGGFEVKVGDSRAFCPFSQMGKKRVDDASVYIGQNLTFKILEYKEGGRNILVSNRAIQNEEKEKQIGILKQSIKVNSKVQATVISLQKFGAFVDIQGVQALLPISEISRSRVEDINAVLEEGQEIEALVIKLDWANQKISVSMKELEGDPWDNIHSKYKEGSRYTGKVVRLTDFGAFVSLEPGLDGLIHISEMKGDSRDSNPSDFVKKGESITVKINRIDVEQKRLSLKPLSSTEEDQVFQKYMEPETDTYNPFAALLKDKVKESKTKKGKK